MSASGQTRTFLFHGITSALPQKPDMDRGGLHVRSCQERTLAQNSESLACNNKTSADCPC
jgi:hypothetical protein